MNVERLICFTLYKKTDDIPLHELKSKPLTDIEKAIGKHIAENLVEDGATLQMGIGKSVFFTN